MPDYRVPGGVRATIVGDGSCVLLNISNGTVFALNVTGAAVWHALAARGESAAQAVASVVSRYPEEPAIIDRDVRVLITDLARNGLLIRECR